MIFIILTFLTAFLIEGLGTAVSVIGLSALFGANPIIIALAISLDMGKLVVVSMLYKHWKQMGVMMKSYALLAASVTMIITSAGASAYLSGEFQKAIMGAQETALKVDVLKKQQEKYETRKKQIDDQIANLPSNYSKSRISLMKQFDIEQKDLQSKIEAIDKQLPDMQIHQIGVEAKAGPILYIAKAFGIPVEVAVKYVVLLIIFVFDPLAVFLIIAGNFLLDRRKLEPDVREEKLDEFNQDLHGGEFPERIPNAKTLGAMVEAEQKVLARHVEHQELLSEESITEVKPSALVTPEEPETVLESTIQEQEQEHIVPVRDEITLADLRPHRSSLNDARGDGSVVFDQNPRDSQHGGFYSTKN